MSDSISSQPKQLFCSGQIVALDNTNSILYGEVIQIIPQRQMCWIRTIALTYAPDSLRKKLPNSEDIYYDAALSQESASRANYCIDSDMVIVDLHRSIDLLFPINLFRVAFDTEMIPLLSKINPSHDSCLQDTQAGKQQLNQFLKEIWQTNQDKFKV
ncbi:MAG: hypothetical protein QNJ70_14225 [Xenococcaceae cyanobacterium MO_207.B15]|nr:hypothetical protein [Xenococcaceae cyanobacterium MO_207.B15]